MLEKIKQRGGRLTANRLALLRLISISEGHPNAAELFDRMRETFPTISLATVYKTLAMLKEEGEVLEIALRDESRYDGNKPYPHPHLICQHCGKVIDGDEMTSLAIVHQEIHKMYDFQVHHANVVFYGTCGDCQDE
ncbi:MAG: Fur family transcriptional regulator [Anaerolineae bacterium]|jgi:Fur family peroxide stress response transcriptional regulator|nr:Fur family transcriptional regulator [Anaerolineae bacterium]